MSSKEQVKRRLYTLYDAQIVKLGKLARMAGISQSEYLRQLIDVDFAAKTQANAIGRTH